MTRTSKATARQFSSTRRKLPGMRIALAQLNQIVGDLDGNRDRILGALAEAKAGGVQLVVFPELAVTGYPPEDLLLRPGFLRAAEQTLASIAAEAQGVVALVGAPLYDGDLFNACAVCADGEGKAYARKRVLPTYGVSDEHRSSAAGREPPLLDAEGSRVGVTICEDMWQPGPPASELALAGAELLV